MSKKNKSRLAKKQKRKEKRKTLRKLRKLNLFGRSSDINSCETNVVTVDQQQNGINSKNGDLLIVQTTSTSPYCKKQLSPKKSPWKNAGGKVDRFKKIFDNQARKLVRRSICIVKDKQVVGKITLKKRLNNNNKENNMEKSKNKDLFRNTSALEEGEIRSDTERSFASAATCDAINNYDDEDDCIIIEPTLEEITIDDDNIPSTSDISIMNSFKDRVSSTPCQNRKSPRSSASVVNNINKYSEKSKTEDILPFYVDVAPSYGTESINSTDNFTDYIKLSTLKENSQTNRTSVDLKQITGGGEVIDLDDTSCDNTDTTLKPKSGNMDDDSIIFISESNKNDFIPIVDCNIPKRKVLKVNEPLPKTPENRLRTNNLFTKSETKKLNEYNENAYNPSTMEVLTAGKRMIIIDGSNVAFKHGLDQEFSVKGLKIAIDYFEKMGHEVKAVIPQFRMNKTKSTNPEELERLHKAGKIVQTPCKNLPGYMSTSYDDRFILQLAFTLDAAIVSNDNYRDLLHENPTFKKIVENRVIGYTWCNDIFILPKDPYGKWGPSLHTILNRC